MTLESVNGTVAAGDALLVTRLELALAADVRAVILADLVELVAVDGPVDRMKAKYSIRVPDEIDRADGIAALRHCFRLCLPFLANQLAAVSALLPQPYSLQARDELALVAMFVEMRDQANQH